MPLLSPDFDQAVTSLEADWLRTAFWLHSLERLARVPEAAELPPFAIEAVHSALSTGALLVQA